MLRKYVLVALFVATALAAFGSAPRYTSADYVSGGGASASTPAPTLPPATPLAFGTPGVLSIFGNPELQPYAGATPCSAGQAVTVIDKTGATTCAAFGSGSGNVVATPLSTPQIPKAVGATSIADGTLSDNITSVVTATNAGLGSKMTNDTITGTTANKLVKQSGGKAIIVASTDVGGVLGICDTGCGTTGSASIITAGPASCVFDNSVVQGDYFSNSTSVAGDCTDVGTTPTNGTPLLGTVTNANAAAGTRTVWYNGPDAANITNLKGGSGKNGLSSGAANAIQISAGSGGFTSDAGFTENTSTHALLLSGSSAGGDINATVSNTNAGATANTTASLVIKTAGTATGSTGSNPLISWQGPGVNTSSTTFWTTGVARDSGNNSPLVLGAWGTNTQLANAILELTGGGSGQTLAYKSAVSNPSYSFIGDTGTGTYSAAANELDFAVNGTQRGYFGLHIFDVTESRSGNSTGIELDNTSNTASSDANVIITTAGTSAGNTMVRFLTIGATNGGWTWGHGSGNNPRLILSNSDGTLTTPAVTFSANGASPALAAVFGGGVMPVTAAVGSLPTCDSSHKGMLATATDCNAACTMVGTCTTGGSTVCPMYCDGSAWKEG